MPNASIGGMISGLDTATIISQLMQLEARSQTQLKSRVSLQQKQITSLQTVNAKLAALVTKAGDLTKTGAWSPTTATSSNDKVTVTAASTATPGSLTFTVSSLATASRSTYAATGTLDAQVISPNLQYQVKNADGSVRATVATGTGTLSDVAAALNANGTGLRATLVRSGTDAQGKAVYRLDVTSSATGAASGFAIEEQPPADTTGWVPTAFLGGEVGTQVVGTDAELVVNGQTLTSASNTVTGLMPGVDVTLSAAVGAGEPVTITVARDAKGMTANVKALVDAVNAALDDISSLTAYGVDGKSAGILAGDSTLRGVRDQLLSAITAGVSSKSMATYGIEVDRYGKVTFDEAKFQKAYETDPGAATTAFTSSKADGGTYDGLAVTLKQLADTASNSTTGTVTSAIKGRTESIDDMNDAIDAWDVRLETKRLALQRQYAALEVALGSLQNQSSWLAGQIAGLPKMSSGS